MVDGFILSNNYDAKVSTQTIGILGGSFDPIHFGHLRLALEVLSHCEFSQIRFIPCGQHVHKRGSYVSARHRMAMLELALCHHPCLEIDDREINREGPSFMVDTLQALRNDFPEASLCLVLGADIISQLETWYQWQRLLELANLVIVNRHGYAIESSVAVNGWLQRAATSQVIDLHRHQSQCVYYQEIPSLEISSQAIRKQLSAKQAVDFLLPEAVLTYIKHHHLYEEAVCRPRH